MVRAAMLSLWSHDITQRKHKSRLQSWNYLVLKRKTCLGFSMGFLKAGSLGDFVFSQQANITQVSLGCKFLSTIFHTLNTHYIPSSLILVGPSAICLLLHKPHCPILISSSVQTCSVQPGDAMVPWSSQRLIFPTYLCAHWDLEIFSCKNIFKESFW